MEDICRKLGIKISSMTPKEGIYKECERINLTLPETEMVYDYFRNHTDEFMINPKVFFTYGKIVHLIVVKLNITTP